MQNISSENHKIVMLGVSASKIEYFRNRSRSHAFCVLFLCPHAPIGGPYKVYEQNNGPRKKESKNNEKIEIVRCSWCLRVDDDRRRCHLCNIRRQNDRSVCRCASRQVLQRVFIQKRSHRGWFCLQLRDCQRRYGPSQEQRRHASS